MCAFLQKADPPPDWRTYATLHLSLITLLLVAACHETTDPVSDVSPDAPAFAAPGKLVAPGALTPSAVPGPGATVECRKDGRWIICHTFVAIESVKRRWKTSAAA